MARPNQERELDGKKGSPPEADAWGTWEELLLAYAVNRFGTNSWDSISSELRKRCTAPIVFTPKHCKQKYHELERRFTRSNREDVDIDDGSETTAAADAVPWLEELRKLRVAELQRGLQNFDTYISSLQLKVKKLTEESEKKPDLVQNIDEIEIKIEEEGDNKPPDLEQVPGVDDSDKDNQSMNGSNGNLDTGAEKSENESTPVDEKPGSSAHSPTGPEPDTQEPVKTEPCDLASQEPESKSEQSSASKSRKERSDRVRRGSSKTDERENEDQSRNSIPVRSLPLIDILQKVHKLGSAFLERRLDRQEKLKYKNLIREHIDLEILQTRLKEGWYSDGNKKFFRDLLLLINNTRIFFPNESQESISANKVRQFIMNEMASKKKQKPDSNSNSKQTTLPPKQPSDSVLLKPKLVPPMIVCKKRTSIASKETGVPSVSKKSGKSIREDDDEVSEEHSKSNNNDKKKKPIEVEEKKRSAAKFLNRMKQSLVNEAAGGGGGGGDGGGKKEEGGKRSSGGGKRKEEDSPSKKGVGRPPKKVAAQTPAGGGGGGGGLGKRSREDGESESLKQGKKKSKRL